MPKAKPITLYPLSFEKVINTLLKATPKPQKKQKPKKTK